MLVAQAAPTAPQRGIKKKLSTIFIIAPAIVEAARKRCRFLTMSPIFSTMPKNTATSDQMIAARIGPEVAYLAPKTKSIIGLARGVTTAQTPNAIAIRDRKLKRM